MIDDDLRARNGRNVLGMLMFREAQNADLEIDQPVVDRVIETADSLDPDDIHEGALWALDYLLQHLAEIREEPLVRVLYDLYGSLGE